MSTPTVAPPRPEHRSPRLAVITLLSSVAIANVAYTVLIPFVPTLSREFGMSATAIGVAFGGFAATKAVLQPFGGWVADRAGARITATAGLVLAALATGALAFAENGLQIIVLRLIWGVGEGISIPALYHLAGALGRTSHTGEAQVLGWFGSAAVLGMTAGPGMVALLSGVLTFTVAFLLGGLLTLMAAMLVLVGVSEPVADHDRNADAAPDAVETGGTIAREGVPSSLITVLLVLNFGVLDLVNNFVYAALEPVVPLYAGNALHAQQRIVSAVFFAGLALFAVFAALAGRIVPRVGLLRAAGGSFAVQAGALLIASWTGRFLVFVIGFLVVMCVQPLVYVAVRTAVAQLGRQRPGAAFGWFGMVSDIGWVVGPIVAAGLLTDLGGAVFAVLAGLAVLAGGGSAGLALLARRAVDRHARTA